MYHNHRILNINIKSPSDVRRGDVGIAPSPTIGMVEVVGYLAPYLNIWVCNTIITCGISLNLLAWSVGAMWALSPTIGMEKWWGIIHLIRIILCMYYNHRMLNIDIKCLAWSVGAMWASPPTIEMVEMVDQLTPDLNHFNYVLQPSNAE